MLQEKTYFDYIITSKEGFLKENSKRGFPLRNPVFSGLSGLDSETQQLEYYRRVNLAVQNIQKKVDSSYSVNTSELSGFCFNYQNFMDRWFSTIWDRPKAQEQILINLMKNLQIEPESCKYDVLVLTNQELTLFIKMINKLFGDQLTVKLQELQKSANAIYFLILYFSDPLNLSKVKIVNFQNKSFGDLYIGTQKMHFSGMCTNAMCNPSKTIICASDVKGFQTNSFFSDYAYGVSAIGLNLNPDEPFPTSVQFGEFFYLADASTSLPTHVENLLLLDGVSEKVEVYTNTRLEGSLPVSKYISSQLDRLLLTADSSALEQIRSICNSMEHGTRLKTDILNTLAKRGHTNIETLLTGKRAPGSSYRIGEVYLVETAAGYSVRDIAAGSTNQATNFTVRITRGFKFAQTDVATYEAQVFIDNSWFKVDLTRDALNSVQTLCRTLADQLSEKCRIPPTCIDARSAVYVVIHLKQELNKIIPETCECTLGNLGNFVFGLPGVSLGTEFRTYPFQSLPYNRIAKNIGTNLNKELVSQVYNNEPTLATLNEVKEAYWLLKAIYFKKTPTTADFEVSEKSVEYVEELGSLFCSLMEEPNSIRTMDFTELNQYPIFVQNCSTSFINQHNGLLICTTPSGTEKLPEDIFAYTVFCLFLKMVYLANTEGWETLPTLEYFAEALVVGS